MIPHFILYVADQERAKAFYARVLAKEPRLHVPGMTEFELGSNAVLGLMPEKGIRRLLGNEHFADDAQSPRAELYLLVDDPQAHLDRATNAGAIELSPLLSRDWGHDAAYCLDPDNHVLAFARVSS